MKYILKVYKNSKYFGFKKQEYIEFNSYEEVMIYVCNKKIKYDNYEIYAKINLWGRWHYEQRSDL